MSSSPSDGLRLPNHAQVPAAPRHAFGLSGLHSHLRISDSALVLCPQPSQLMIPYFSRSSKHQASAASDAPNCRRYELHHGVRISDSALVDAAVMSDRYIADRFLPDKAIDLVDEAAAKLKMEITSKPLALDETDRRVLQLEMERLSLSKASQTDKCAPVHTRMPACLHACMLLFVPVPGQGCRVCDGAPQPVQGLSGRQVCPCAPACLLACHGSPCTGSWALP